MNADSQFAEGVALLEESREPADGPRAIALMESAAEQGHADAEAMCALFEAMGAGRPQNWSQALDRIQRAAELGSDSAQGQLLALAESRVDAPEGPDRWAALRSQLSPEALLAVPQRRSLSEAPRIRTFEGFATAAECGWIIAKARDRLKPAKVVDASTGDHLVAQVRNNSAIEFLLPQMDVVIEVIRARISAATRLPVPIFEPSQVLHYAVGQEFRPHYDFLDPNEPGFADNVRLRGQRIGTMLLYLNDEFTGGETAFPNAGISHRGATGDAIFFANVDRTGAGDPLTLHAGTPPLSGAKWIFSQWIRDRMPTPADANGASESGGG